jgi:stage III sporulation protein AF
MNAYIQRLIWLMLFVAIVELVFPTSDLKRYLKLTLGFIVLTILLQPILQYLKAGELHQSTVRDFQNILEVETGIQQEMDTQTEKIKSLYREQYALQMSELVKNKCKVQPLETTVDVDIVDGAPQITAVYLWVSEDLEASSSTIHIPMIRIGDKSIDETLDVENLEKEIKTCLNDFYNVDKDNIYITVQKN